MLDQALKEKRESTLIIYVGSLICDIIFLVFSRNFSCQFVTLLDMIKSRGIKTR